MPDAPSESEVQDLECRCVERNNDLMDLDSLLLLKGNRKYRGSLHNACLGCRAETRGSGVTFFRQTQLGQVTLLSNPTLDNLI